MCMPAFRRFVARFLPACFGSTLGSSALKYRQYEDEEPRSGKRKQNTLGGSLFQSAIMKTVDTRVEETRGAEDAVRLVELNKGKESGEDISTHKSESLYKAQHKETLPKDW
ncbi:hypothetical protein GQ44DRAFT_801799 [Phaeosphaeriaceae sp. PMI808]|nr:hypothetical protein GQ44DRAFT_801799 [Phaeosphaeriaceae sp. PMI808]